MQLTEKENEELEVLRKNISKILEKSTNKERPTKHVLENIFYLIDNFLYRGDNRDIIRSIECGILKYPNRVFYYINIQLLNKHFGLCKNNTVVRKFFKIIGYEKDKKSEILKMINEVDHPYFKLIDRKKWEVFKRKGHESKMEELMTKCFQMLDIVIIKSEDFVKLFEKNSIKAPTAFSQFIIQFLKPINQGEFNELISYLEKKHPNIRTTNILLTLFVAKYTDKSICNIHFTNFSSIFKSTEFFSAFCKEFEQLSNKIASNKLKYCESYQSACERNLQFDFFKPPGLIHKAYYSSDLEHMFERFLKQEKIDTNKSKPKQFQPIPASPNIQIPILPASNSEFPIQTNSLQVSNLKAINDSNSNQNQQNSHLHVMGEYSFPDGLVNPDPDLESSFNDTFIYDYESALYNSEQFSWEDNNEPNEDF